MNDFNATGSKNITVLGEEELGNVVGGWGGRHHSGGNHRNGGYNKRGRGGNDGGDHRGATVVRVVFIDARTFINVVNNAV